MHPVFLTTFLRQLLARNAARASPLAELDEVPGKSPGEKLLIVSATRESAESFLEKAPLGRSLRRLSVVSSLEARLAFDNRDGLPSVYNRQICEENREKVLLFVHDDVWLDDFFVHQRISDALTIFDVVGVAGNTRRQSRQPAWGFSSENPFTVEDSRYPSGGIAHGEHGFGAPMRFGPPGLDCRLLDGVFLAARCKALLDSGVRFDERFMFDFYDIDFCRSAEAASLRMGTWPIAITHASLGVFGRPAWHEGLRAYREKWGD